VARCELRSTSLEAVGKGGTIDLSAGKPNKAEIDSNVSSQSIIRKKEKKSYSTRVETFWFSHKIIFESANQGLTLSLVSRFVLE
jgi:hypothetical protein